MNWIDLASAVILFVFFFAGLLKGLIREVMTLVGVIVSFFAALHLAGIAAPWVLKWVVLPPRVSLFVGFLVVFILLLVLFHILGYVLYRVVRATPLTVIDRIAGGLFGVLKGSLIIFLVLLVLSVIPFRGSAAGQLKESYAFRTAQWAAPVFARYLRAAAPTLLEVLRGSKRESARLKTLTSEPSAVACQAEQNRSAPLGVRALP